MLTTLLSTTYFGPVQWYQKLYRSEIVYIDACESFQKQTYRNRCVIATTQGRQTLTVPIEHGSKAIRDIRVSNHGNWRHLHWNTLLSAYGESPFFEYYADDLRPFFEREWKYLFDFNMDIILKMCELIDIQPRIALTEEYLADNTPNDFRHAIHPKHPQADNDFSAKPYYQVFARKHGFQPNLSILDLLFNEGNEAILYL